MRSETKNSFKKKYAAIILLFFIGGILFYKHFHETSRSSASETLLEQPSTEIYGTPADLNEIKTGRVMFAMAIGQSNAANYGERRYKARYGVYIYYKGKLYTAEDPLPGASGKSGSVWGMLGDSLIEKGHYDKVVFVTIAVGSTSAGCWSDGRCSYILNETMEDLKKNNIKLTHILWHQGEEDNYINTPAYLYKSRLKKILGIICRHGENAPLFVSIVSFNPWAGDKPDRIDYGIRRAQREFIEENLNVYTGPDTDTITSSSDRFDRVHFSESGMKKYSELWLKAITSPKK